MKHHIAWHIEGRVAITAYDGDLQLEELKQVNLMLENFANTGQKPVHLIIDTRKMGKFPPNMQIVRESLNALKREEWGWMLIIGSSTLILFFAEVVGKQFGLTIKSVKSIEEAEAVIKRIDSNTK